ncbi:MAG: class I SAM-dependent methyltransferase [Chloroflexia bacterium]
MNNYHAGHILPGESGTVGDGPFSRYAPFYDADEKRNPVALWTRIQNLKRLHSTFGPGDVLLEIGCGTGTEALSLAHRGIRVVATDSAPGMIEQLQAKIGAVEDAEVRKRVTPLVLPVARVGEILTQFGRGTFDGAYSSFGPLNCEADLRHVSRGLGELVRPGGKVVLSFLGRYCLWETAWYLLHGDLRSAFRRWGGHANATVRAGWGTDRIPVFYWSAAELAQTFKADFSIVGRTALPWILPPQYLAGIFRRRRRLFNSLAAIELKTAHLWPANVIGDHIRLTLVRN